MCGGHEEVKEFMNSLLEISKEDLTDSQLEYELFNEMDIFERPVVCASCNTMISDVKFLLSLEGRSLHHFINPSGLRFSFYTFYYTKNTFEYGEPTEEHTWFSGYRWSFLLCEVCQSHLGWYYRNSDDSFFGLVDEKIKFT
ncbi:MAG: hypothetical protein H7A24_06805 [Leptospiraceae bacterium]|nr:hypothetical protein [Leptospiraceae bacterium]MCP5511572.1 hypothetical protein [Leptospiraceae bacterium]